jgi:N6-adenosine-specific RNA methylase IME4
MALPVPLWAESESHLYVWTTATNMKDAFELMDAWGFNFVTVLTWVKPTLGLGAYFRNTTEFVLFGVKGRLRTRVHDIGTHFLGARGIHSEKPEAFFELVERASYPAYLDVFARKQRAGWTVWGNGVGTKRPEPKKRPISLRQLNPLVERQASRNHGGASLFLCLAFLPPVYREALKCRVGAKKG